MRRAICPEGQIDIFPCDVMAELFKHPRPDAPLPPLPFARTDEVSVERACRILGVEKGTLRRLREAELIRGYRIGKGPSATLRIRYSSILELCDSLRRQYLIPPRKATTGARPRDEHVLPFPLRETMVASEAAAHLDVKPETVTKLIDSGDLVGYRLHKTAPFRIHRPSFVAYIERLRRQASAS